MVKYVLKRLCLREHHIIESSRLFRSGVDEANVMVQLSLCL